jgi:hypothetical protein
MLKKARQKGLGGGLDCCCTSKNDLAGLWSNSDSEFSHKSMPRMGPATAARRKPEVKSLL